MHRTRIKICGVCRAEDALSAAQSGADAIGMVFHSGSPRGITVDRAEEIVGVLPAFVTPVALFVDADLSTIQEVTQRLGIRHIQLNGKETAEFVAQLRGYTVLKAMRADRATIAGELDEWRTRISDLRLENLRGLVLETAGAKESGGTGIANDWDLIERLQQTNRFAGLPPLIAAGGLTPDNVGDVVRRLRPWAVDVSSGVEAGVRGVKSTQRIEAFVRSVRAMQ